LFILFQLSASIAQWTYLGTQKLADKSPLR